MRLVAVTGFAVVAATFVLLSTQADLKAEADQRVTPTLEVVAARCSGAREKIELRIVRSNAVQARATLSIYDGTARRSYRIGQATKTLKRARSTVTVGLNAPASILSDCAIRTGRTLTLVAQITPQSGRPYTLYGKQVGTPAATASAPVVITTPTTATTGPTRTADADPPTPNPVVPAPAADADPPTPDPVAPARAEATSSRSLGTVGAPVVEASGLAWSRTNASTWWTHNDSGDSARIFALDGSARIHATLPLSGAAAVDWEDIATGPGPTAGSAYLYVGDIGDNAAARASVRVYRVLEPDLTGVAVGTTLPAASIGSVVLQYPDGARDAESLLVDQTNGDLYVISKREARVRVYRATSPAFAGETIILQHVATLDHSWVVAADVCPDNATVLVKTTTRIYAYVSDSGIAAAFAQPPAARLYAAEPQGEAIAANPTCTGFATLSEGSNQPLMIYEQ